MAQVFPLAIVVVVVILGAAVANPFPEITAPRHYRNADNQFDNQTKFMCTSSSMGQSSINSGIRDERRRWKNFYVNIDNEYTDNERGAINNAMYSLSQELPCVNFGIYRRGSNPSGDHIQIKSGAGCNSYIGRIGGKQTINLNRNGCLSKGTIMHEMIHALGFDHEHSRPDRDDFVNILYDNIDQENWYAFEKLSDRDFSTFGVPYDKNSVMHYHGTAFSINGRDTITAKDGGYVGRLNNELRESDKQKLKAMYKC